LDYSGNRYVVNFFGDGSQIKSGTIGQAVTLGIVEQFVS
jgi:hypothetical protein